MDTCGPAIVWDKEMEKLLAAKEDHSEEKVDKWLVLKTNPSFSFPFEDLYLTLLSLEAPGIAPGLG